jgi:undecaprenyl-diphosphatase
MSISVAILLAVIQGLTEFLPISSSAHLALAPWLFGWKDQGLAFDISLHFGTLLAVLLYFFRDWVQLVCQAAGIGYAPDPVMAKKRHLFWWLVVATLPVGLVGFIVKDYAETTLRNPWVIGTMLITVGLLMGYAEKIGKRLKQFDGMTFSDALSVGFAQALAVVPGTSRSGITITAGLFRNLDRATAARFSFLLSTPAIAGAALKDFWDLHKQGGVPADEKMAYITGIAVSGLTGLAVIAFFLKYLRTHGLRFFVLYRIIFGIIVIALAIFRGTP